MQPSRSIRLAALVAGLGQSLAGSAGALLARQVGRSDVNAGLPQTLLVIGAGGAALALSELTRRRGRRDALVAGVVTAAAGCAVVVLGGSLGSLGLVLLGHLLLGAGTSTVMLGRYAAADLVPEARRPAAMAAVLTATTVGAVAGANLLSASVEIAVKLPWGLRTGGLLGPYIVAGSCFLFAAVVLAAAAPHPPARAPEPGVAEPSAPAPGAPEPRIGRQGAAGLVVLSTANLVMVAVMTMAPVHLHRHGMGLGAIGLVVSLHIAGMFAPSRLSAWVAERWGAEATARLAGAVLLAACLLAALAADSTLLLPIGLLLVGVGWNVALMAGSVLLTAGVPRQSRPRREGLGEVGTGAAAAVGGAGSGILSATSGYSAVALGAAALSVPLLFVISERRRAAAGSRAATRDPHDTTTTNKRKIAT